ncbi:MAG: hypothetical protein AAFV88_24495 [Planctomycetota bacterium]
MSQENQPTEQITCKCPRGHKLKGKPNLIGKSVRCPRCREKFVFGYQIREQVTDTAVVRLLGDAPAIPPAPKKTGADLRSCTRCGVAISKKTSVCEHCRCYVGHMPDFFDKLSNLSESSHN